MQLSEGSRNAAEERLKRLRREENDVIEELSKNVGSMADKFRLLAKIMEERINYGDQMIDYSVHEISTNIRRYCLSHDPPILAGYHVNDYLDEKYKDLDHAKLGKLKALVNNLEYRTAKRCEQIEQCSAENLPELLESTRNECNERDRLASEAIKIANEKKKEIELVRQRARELGLDSLLDETYRDPATVFNFKYPVPEHLWPKINKVIEHGVSAAESEKEFFTKIYANFPAAIEEDLDKHLAAAETYDNFMKAVVELKWSFDYGGWFDRNYWKDAQSAHKSGNSTKFPTNICAYCSKDVDNDPNDYHVMSYDKTSTTLFRCDRCKGIDVLDQGTSREQVGDKHEEVERMARNVVNHIEHYCDIYKDTREKYLNPAISSRKRVLHEPFSVSAIAGSGNIVVPTKK